MVHFFLCFIYIIKNLYVAFVIIVQERDSLQFETCLFAQSKFAKLEVESQGSVHCWKAAELLNVKILTKI